jgi:UDP-galactopyranose mutase
MKKAIIIGGGYAGCTMSLLLKEAGFEVTLIEKSSQLGGGCRTHFYHGHPYTFGPRHLNVDVTFENVWEFLNKHFDLKILKHRAMTFPSNDEKFFSYPPVVPQIEGMKHKDQILKELDQRNLYHKASNFEDYWENAIGRTLYEGFVKSYSEKMWGIKDNKELLFNTDQLPVHANVPRKEDGDYFDGKQHCAYPKNMDAYNPYFDKCGEGCNLLMNTTAEAFNIPEKKVKVNGEWLEADVIVSTLSIDLLFDYQYGELKYKGRDFIKLILPTERVTPDPYYFMYYAGDEPYTRVFEYKLLTGYKSPNTLLGMEIPSDKNKLYPFPIAEEVEKYKKYKALLPDDVYSIGRMGTYQYMDMARIIKQCLELKEQII